MATSTLDLAALDTAASEGRLELLYQPEIDLDTGAIVAMEGLLRWHHGDLGVLTPPDFLEAAERDGTIGALEEWVLRTGAAEAATWALARGPRRQLWLNVSGTRLVAPGFADLVASLVMAHDLHGRALGIEVTERTVLELGRNAGAVLTELRGAGVALAVDDFSSFYAALGVIESCPVDAVKLGHRYVRGVGEPGHDDAMVASIIERAHARGLYVVAGGVETWGESARLTELGCDRAHGWLFASAQRADRARWLLTQGVGWRGGVVTPGVRSGSIHLPAARPSV